MLIGIFLCGTILLIGTGSLTLNDPLMILIKLIVVIPVAILWFGIRYQIVDQHLLIKIGPVITHRVHIATIDTLSRSYNPISAPAPSLRRIQLRMKNGNLLLISPKHEEMFIKDLKAINPKIYNGIAYEKGTRTFVSRMVDWLL